MVIPYFHPLGVGQLLDFLAVLFLLVDSHAVVRHFVGVCKFGGDFAVEGGEFGFELLQLVLIAPSLGDDGFELGGARS